MFVKSDIFQAWFNFLSFRNSRIQNLIKGRDAYIVPGFMNVDDLHIADILNVPIMGINHEILSITPIRKIW